MNVVQTDMDDWWAEFKRQEDEARQLELELSKSIEEVSRMKVTTHKSFTKSHGTYLQGTVPTTYSELIETFGPPLHGDTYKTRAEWVIEFELGSGESVIATIYDWKKYDTELEEVTQWNVGGFDPRATELVLDYLNYAHDMRIGAYIVEQDLAEQDLA